MQSCPADGAKASKLSSRDVFGQTNNLTGTQHAKTQDRVGNDLWPGDNSPACARLVEVHLVGFQFGQDIRREERLIAANRRFYGKASPCGCGLKASFGQYRGGRQNSASSDASVTVIAVSRRSELLINVCKSF